MSRADATYLFRCGPFFFLEFSEKIKGSFTKFWKEKEMITKNTRKNWKSSQLYDIDTFFFGQCVINFHTPGGESCCAVAPQPPWSAAWFYPTASSRCNFLTGCHAPNQLIPLSLFVMASFLNKKYKLVSSENFDEYMQELSKFYYFMLTYSLLWSCWCTVSDDTFLPVLNWRRLLIQLNVMWFLNFRDTQ